MDLKKITNFRSSCLPVTNLIMKISASLLLASVAQMIDAAALNVGSGKTYSTITAAYNAAAAGDTIYVYPGTYQEKIVITKNSLTIKGSTYPSLNPSANTALITYATYASAVGSNDASATLLINADNFKLYNINVTNTAGTASQAVALSSNGFYGGFYTLGIKAYQDTLYAHSGSQFFSRCYIEGATDFIFGITGNAWFQGVTIGALKANSWITAQGRTASNLEGFFVFDKAKVILGNGAASGVKGSLYLGRPWKDYARVVFQNSNLGSIITSAGWAAWSSSQPTANILFAEYANINGDGTRVSWAKKLSSAYGISTILPTYSSWVDSAYLGTNAP